MALKDQIPFGMSLPHRSPDSISIDAVRTVATKAEALGFRDLWVTENTLDHVSSLDPISILSYAAAVTSRIGLGASVLVLPVHDPRMVAQQWATLDTLSGGRAIMGVGIGRAENFEWFEVAQEARVGRFREQVELIRTLWAQPTVTHHGRFYNVDNVSLGTRPPRGSLPVWMGVGHPDAIRRSARMADGWMGAGGSTTESFRKAVPILREELEKVGRDPAAYPISKRLFIAVDDNAARAKADMHRWYTEVYHNPEGTETSGVHGTPEQVAQKIADLIGAGANHLLLNPIARHVEQLDALAKVVGYS
jgi:alkanesulfonate monooxygenase SsuD/methylene tetrahydromethanopterin reductase-like flavin-dependent oxidoreductase (luciferase family)